jgi:hypothetical protein
MRTLTRIAIAIALAACSVGRADYNPQSLGQQNANNVSITGGTISSTTLATDFLSGPTTLLNGGLGAGTPFVYGVYAMPALAIDVTQEWGTVILTGSDTGHPNEVLTFTGTPSNAVLVVQRWRDGNILQDSAVVIRFPDVAIRWDRLLPLGRPEDE